ncbi:TetR/AcrR family transcriptional regulator [Acrocarpospora macrocephala]|uniref:TetR family transcriptional regulator n=1 Tax=Acrocarpospora macrocephala TaxID=150177 RepID=A0A5M3WM60_9ACTN|nr:TetR/AcrR family transcriptional regulator [Acrocarpospora macrocephala]GES09132.1 TetR family transcriptional regulator [Acrocarpospora macrocephala]
MRTPRKDQVRNRQRLVTAAREAFGEQGPGISLDEVARRAGVGPTTLYRHFPGKEELIEAVLDDLAGAVRENADRAARIEDPLQAFRAVFTQSCDMTERDIATFAQLANVGGRAGEHAQRLIESVVGPAASRLREAGGLRPGITVQDIAVFIRMTLTTGSPESQAKAIETLLDGLAPDRHPGCGPSRRS